MSKKIQICKHWVNVKVLYSYSIQIFKKKMSYWCTQKIPVQYFCYPTIPDWSNIWCKYPYPIRTRTRTRSFLQYPNPIRPEVENTYPMVPGDKVTYWAVRWQLKNENFPVQEIPDTDIPNSGLQFGCHLRWVVKKDNCSNEGGDLLCPYVNLVGEGCGEVCVPKCKQRVGWILSNTNERQFFCLKGEDLWCQLFNTYCKVILESRLYNDKWSFR